MRTLHPWLATVHAHMLAHGERMSARDAVRLFGRPRAAWAAKLMHAALKSGYFRCEQEKYEGWDGACTRTVFIAVQRGGTHHTSFFDSCNNRANSVWQFAEAMR